MPPSQAQIIAALTARTDALEKRQDAADKMRGETYQMVADMHQALMTPQYGQGEKSLLERMAEVTVDIESGRRTTDNLIGLAKRFAYIGAFMALVGGILLKLGLWTKE